MTIAYPDIAPTARVEFHIDGTPNVADLPCDEIVIGGDVYMRRYWLSRTREASVRFHEILRSDAGRDLHDHPWDFTTFILKGAYVEITEFGDQRYEACQILHRSAESLHRLTLNEGPVWTYVVTGAVRRRWGFQTSRGWVYHLDYDQEAAS